MKVGFVIPWFGPDIPGGAEALCRSTALKLFEAGVDVEILTTCVKEFHSDWNVNFHKPGIDDYRGIPVRRFKVRKRDTVEFDRVNRRLMSGLSIAPGHERIFINEMVRSNDLIRYMKSHEEEYAYVLLPYMFGTTFFGATSCPKHSVLIPCLHDESYAYMGSFRQMCEGVRGMIFNSRSEKELAMELYDLPSTCGVVAGVGVDTDFESDGNRFKAKHGLRQYVLYAGRKDEGKNVKLLVDYFCQYKRTFGGDLKLVLIGNGKVAIPDVHVGRDVIDLGFVSTQEKYDAYAGALVLCQPSLFESFSIVMMEAWIAGTPSLVLEGCLVTREHCVASQGGLYFSSPSDFAGALNYLLKNPEIRDHLGQNGTRYVRANFTWSQVIGKYLRAFHDWELDV